MSGEQVVLRVYVPGVEHYVAQVLRLDEPNPVVGTLVWRAAVELEYVPLSDEHRVPGQPWRLVGSADPRDDAFRRVSEVERSLAGPWAGWAWVPGCGNTLIPLDRVHHALRTRQRKLVHRPTPASR